MKILGKLALLFTALALLGGCKVLLKKSAIHITNGPKLPIGIYEMGYASDGKIIFSVGGSTFLGTQKQALEDVFLFSPFTNEWQKARFAVKPVIKGPANSAYVPESNLLVTTGFAEPVRSGEYSFPLEVLHLSNYRLEYIRTNPHFAVGSGIVSYQGKLYVFGGLVYGRDGGSAISNRVLEYNFATGQWTDLAPMPMPRVTKGVVVGESLYTFGGYDDQHAYAEVWRYDFVEDFWETVTYLPYPARDFGLALEYPYVYLVNVGEERSMIGRMDMRDGGYREFEMALALVSPGAAVVAGELFIFGGSRDEGKTASIKTFRIPLSEFEVEKK